ncbi:uncharacterized protein CANTADRAFT_4274 [Suhomyces tanzawaensis NRRL Y-17324]|uniref:Uncharacterized protein n=1 Tax=Suhomyces tanzawaensis NRRL Y-17324 TaxID=984487 RepID=A0A1E4SRY1_9ASCO|nr:uncharacterized protein CANTADRAFT_4274 [Suhomyces tanzawaensis NRRL Y-17324]ODV82255.1 hypothetical protein CANTADRAFT_4274 [Suhomyces tanzawaensis NRRL Y-17324]
MVKKFEETQLSSKDKRYIQQVEKVLSSFDSLEEWADYIAFLSRLHKSLQLADDRRGYHSLSWIPSSSLVANKLALCLSSRLPNGVHQKTLSLYESIFKSLSIESFNSELFVWLPGIFPLLSYCSIQVKPQLIKILREDVLANLSPSNLKVITKPLILSLLPGLDDENSEVFTEIIDLVDEFKLRLADDSHFWQSMFLCIISNPEKRLGALLWCSRRLPVLTTIKNNGLNQFSEEAHACLSPEPGLLIRAFATSISGTSKGLNSASDVIVIRGFFDLLMTHLPLNSEVFRSHVLAKDKELLIMACCRVTLKKDMSLNRRLWNYFLGPELELDNPVKNDRSKYFETHALDTLSTGFLKMIETSSIKKKIEAFKISLSIIMDKWEISNLVTPRLFSPFLQVCFESRENKEILIAGQMFFDGIESSFIWAYITDIILKKNDEDLKLLEFVLSTFNFNEEEMITMHAPLAIICLLSDPHLSVQRVSILEVLLSLVPQRAYTPLGSTETVFSSQQLVNTITMYYDNSLIDENTQSPFKGEEITNLVVDLMKNALITGIQDIDKSYRLSCLLSDLLRTIPQKHGDIWFSSELVSAIISLPKSRFDIDDDSKLKSNALISLGIAKVFNYMSSSLSTSIKETILGLVITNIWYSVYSTQPGNYQFESVKAIYELQLTCLQYKIEAGILHLMNQVPLVDRIQAFSTLWIHSTSINDGDLILLRPLQLILNESDKRVGSTGVIDFVKNIVVKNGSTNRLLKLITSPLLNFELMNSSRLDLKIDDDLGQFTYHINTILNVCRTNPKPLKDAFSHELAVMDSGTKLNLIKSNNWDISTYKSLVCSVISKFFHLRITQALVADQSFLEEYLDCISNCLELLKFLLTGNEQEFVSTFHLLVSSCSYCFTIHNSLYTIELIQTRFLDCIYHFLEMSEDLKINLNLLHVDDEGKDSLLIRFIIDGITHSKTSLLLESWLSLLTRSLYLFNESVFSVLFTLNDCIIKKIESYFYMLERQDKFDDLVDVEASTNTLISGLESLLSISHSFLLASSIKFNKDKANSNNETGFFGSVIQGVFLIESPAIRTSEQNKLFSILLSFQDAVKVCFKLWQWADSKPAIIVQGQIGEKSQIYLAHKLKFRARKMLESLLDLEKQEVIETLVSVDGSMSSAIKLLNILDGGRSQITLPFLFDSIITRCYPPLLEESKRSTLNIPITEKDLSNFLVSYFESIDTDTISDIWDSTIQFLKNVLAHSNHFKAILPDCLKVVKVLSVKISSSGLREKSKSKRILSEIFIKMLTNMVSGKSGNLDLSDSEKEGEDNTQVPGVGNSLIIQDDTLDALVVVLEHLDIIIEDADKASASLNVIIANLVTPQIKSKKINEISFKTLAIVDLIGKYNPNKTWKNLVSDSFMDSSFFEMNTTKLKLWNSIITTWISIEKEKIHDLILRVTPLVLSSPSNIFTWNENSEIESKIQCMKRIAYLILIQPKDYFLNYLDVIFRRLEDSLNTTCPPSYRCEIAKLLRAITLKFDEIHLLPRWTVICHELTAIFDLVLARNVKDSNVFSEEELQLILHGCKLLDQLLLLGCDEFNLNEWLFVSSNSEIINGSSRTSIIAAVDRISNEKDLTNLKDQPITIEQPQSQEELSLLLQGIKQIDSITQLRLFFDNLSLINYERTYGLFEVNYKRCEDDILNDLV